VSNWVTPLLALSWGNGNLKWVLLIGLLLGGLIIFWVRSKKRAARRPVPTVTVAWLLIILPWLLSTSPRSFAHGGEDHSEAAKTPSSPAPSLTTGKFEEMSNNTSIRLPDGSVFVPKPIQHLLGLRTRLVKTTEVAQGIELNNGHIIPDPNYSGVVQAPLAGRIELTDSGLPTLGQTVNKGQILAYLVPIASDVDRSNQQVELANLDGQIDIVKKNINRLNKLGNNAAHRDLEDAQLELHSLQTRRQTLGASLSKRIPLMVPLAGVIATSKVLAGQVVDAREILFEIVNPDKFWVEALIYDSALAEQIGTAQALTANQQILSLRLLGLTYRLREHALPLQFRITSPSPLPFLTLEQPVKVFATLKQTFRGILLPNGAVLKGNDSQSLVWIHDHAEHFKPVKVQVQPVDGSQVAVVSGLTEGDRVITEGATLLGPIR
jgi:multidrug efflux pump subunit AcrA (membrane-fusion protein)